MGRLHAHVRPHVRAHVRSPLSGRAGGLSVHDGISFTASNGRVVIKAPGAAPTITTLTSAFTFTGGNQSMYRGPSGLLIQSVTNTPRIEYGPGGDVLGLLMESSRTNLILQSQTFDNASWTKTQATITADTTTAPDGTLTADKLKEDATAAAVHFTTQGVAKAASNLTYAFTVWLKASERTSARIRIADAASGANAVRSDVDLTAGTITAPVAIGVGWTAGTSVITPYANGWYRCTVTGTSDAGLNINAEIFLSNPVGTVTYNGDNTSGIFVWGAQLEQASFASSYIPTTTVSVARAADSCIRTLSTEFSATAGTVVVAGRASGGQDAAATQAVYAFDDGTLANSIRFTRVAAADTSRFGVFVASVAQAALDATFVNSTNYKSAAAWTLNDFASSFNGAAVLTDALGTIPTVTTLSVGLSAAASQANGHIRAFDYYSVRMPNEFLVARST